MFVSGILLYESMNLWSVRTPSGFFGLMALALGLLATLLPLEGSSGSALKTSIRFASFWLLCLACFRNPLGWLAAAFSWKPGRWLGNMSYSYYLLHGLVLKGCFLALAVVLPIRHYDLWLFWALLPAMFGVTLIPTAALFLVVERPFSLAPPRGRRSENCGPTTGVAATAEGPRAGLLETVRREHPLREAPDRRSWDGAEWGVGG